jgi:hypothetical protein
MVLHLLGKKSWNVYNGDNVERVRRDEAANQAREEEAERRMQEEDATRRIAILRGEIPPPISSSASPPPEASASSRVRSSRRDGHGDQGRDRKRRRLGEDDTDREMRIAREDAATGAAARHLLNSNSDKKQHAAAVSITDHAGHIQLFTAPDDEKGLLANSRNANAEAEKAKKTRELEDQYTMRFSNAAGFKQSTCSAPWYVSSDKQGIQVGQSRDVWGKEDPSRKDREQTRLTSTDPMALMRKAQTQLRQSEMDKEKCKVQRERELRELKLADRDERRSHGERRHRREHREGSVSSLEGFSLDARHGKDRKDVRHEKRNLERAPRTRSRDDRRGHASSSHRSHRRRSRSPA